MNKLIILLFALLIFNSCQQNKNYDDTKKLCQILGDMTENDQKYRGLPEVIDPFFRVLDSLKEENQLSNDDYTALTREEQREWGKRARAISEKISRINKEKQDSLMELQIQIDNRNTALLIDIVNERGWVTKNELGCEEYFSAWLVFRHSQHTFWDDIRTLIEREKKEGRIGIGDYKMIDNHLKGRPAFNSSNITIE